MARKAPARNDPAQWQQLARSLAAVAAVVPGRLPPALVGDWTAVQYAGSRLDYVSQYLSAADRASAGELLAGAQEAWRAAASTLSQRDGLCELVGLGRLDAAYALARESDPVGLVAVCDVLSGPLAVALTSQAGAVALDPFASGPVPVVLMVPFRCVDDVAHAVRQVGVSQRPRRSSQVPPMVHSTVVESRVIAETAGALWDPLAVDGAYGELDAAVAAAVALVKVEGPASAQIRQWRDAALARYARPVSVPRSASASMSSPPAPYR